MTLQAPWIEDESDALDADADQAAEDDLWFLPGPMEEEPDDRDRSTSWGHAAR